MDVPGPSAPFFSPPAYFQRSILSLGQSIRSGVKWLVAGNIGNQVLQFAFGIALARLLAPSDFGLLATTQIFTGFVGLMATGGMGDALIQAKRVEERDFHGVFTAQLAIGFVIYLGFFLVSPHFAVWFDDPRYENLLRVSTLSFLLRPFVNIPGCRLSRDMRFRERALVNFVSMIFSGLSCIAMAVSGFGVWSLVVGGLLGSVSSMVLFFRLAHWWPKIRFDAEVVHRYGSFGFLTTVNNLVCHFRSQIANLILSRLSGPAAVGLFNKADSLARTPFMVISTSAYDTVFRALSTSQDNLDQARYLYHKMISLLIVYTLPMYLGLGWVAGPFIEVVYGPKWVAATGALEILALSGLLWCLIHPAGAVLAAMKWLDREILAQAIWLIISASSCFVAMRWGLNGVAWAVVLSQVYAAVHMTCLAHRCLAASSIKLFSALFASLLPSALMIGALAVFEMVVGTHFRSLHPAEYLVSATVVGAATYASAFLYLPIRLLESEAQRWKKTLRLARD